MTRHPSQFDRVTILSGQNLAINAVLGRTVTAGVISGSAFSGNTGGSGGISALTVSGGAIEGVYKIVMIEPGANAGTFIVEDPNGCIVGRGVVGTPFGSDHINFTIADATDFVSGDGFNVKVSQLTRKWKALDPAGTDGSNRAAGILAEPVNASGGDQSGAVVVRNSEFNSAALVWPVGISSEDKSIAEAQLRSLGLVAVL